MVIIQIPKITVQTIVKKPAQLEHGSETLYLCNELRLICKSATN